MNKEKQKRSGTTRSRRIEARVSDAELKRIVPLAPDSTKDIVFSTINL